MKRAWWLGFVCVGAMVVGTVAWAAAPADSAKAAGSSVQKLRVKKVFLGISHRAFADFHDEVAVKVGEDFTVGSTNYSARVLRFEPDFVIEMGTRQVHSKSNNPDNPAFQIATFENGAPHDTSWAFLNFPPHFAKKSLLAFQVLRIEFENHAPVMPKPTGGMPAMPPAGAGHGGAPADSAAKKGAGR